MIFYFFWNSSILNDIISGFPTQHEIILLVFGIIFLLMLCEFRRNKYQFELKRICEEQHGKLIMAAIQNEECVRTKLSDNLHDVGTALSTVKLYLNLIQPTNLSDKNKINTLKDCKDLIDNTVQTARDLSAFLQPATIKDFGLTDTLQSFFERLNESTGLKTNINIAGNLDRFAIEQELAVFRIMQELTDNIIKHANATSVNFSLLFKTNNKLQILIEHDGNGLSHQQFEQKLYSMKGLGLKNIQNRLNILKGNLHFEKSDTLMNMISVQIPITV